MSYINDGGPAFPMTSPKWHEIVKKVGYEGCDFTMGMTLRDYFAAESLAGLMVVGGSYEELATSAYRMADAMLKAREAA